MVKEIDIQDLSDNDFVQTGNVLFNRRNIIQKTFVNPYQIVSMLKSFAAASIEENWDNEDYWPIDLMRDCSEFIQRISLSVSGRSMKMYNTLWNINSVKHRLKKKEKEEKLEYE